MNPLEAANMQTCFEDKLIPPNLKILASGQYTYPIPLITQGGGVKSKDLRSTEI
jgi:hypothetical protein